MTEEKSTKPKSLARQAADLFDRVERVRESAHLKINQLVSDAPNDVRAAYAAIVRTEDGEP